VGEPPSYSLNLALPLGPTPDRRGRWYTAAMYGNVGPRRTMAWGLAAGLLLALAGCSVSLNLPAEGPDGSVAVVLSPSGEYKFFGQGVVWVLDREGNSLGEPFVPGETQLVQVCDASPEGWLLLALDTDEYGFPVRSKLLEWSPGGEAREIFACPELLFSPCYAGDERVFFLRSEEESASLWASDRGTGEAVLLEGGVLAFLPAGERTVVLHADGTFASLGHGGLPIRISCEEECAMTFLFFAQVSLAADPSGRYIAVALEEEPVILQPDVERVPTLYLVDLVEGRVERIATPAISPAFSPDGTGLAFVGQAPGRPVQEVLVGDLEASETAPVAKSEGALWVRWGKTGLLAAIEGTPARLVRLMDGKATDLLPTGP